MIYEMAKLTNKWYQVLYIVLKGNIEINSLTSLKVGVW